MIDMHSICISTFTYGKTQSKLDICVCLSCVSFMDYFVVSLRAAQQSHDHYWQICIQISYARV